MYEEGVVWSQGVPPGPPNLAQQLERKGCWGGEPRIITDQRPTVRKKTGRPSSGKKKKGPSHTAETEDKNGEGEQDCSLIDRVTHITILLTTSLHLHARPSFFRPRGGLCAKDFLCKGKAVQRQLANTHPEI